MSHIETSTVFGHRYTPNSKALQFQCVTNQTPGSLSTEARGGFGDAFVGSWALVAPPVAPDVDSSGRVTGGCESLVVQEGDQLVAFGQRDVRWSKFSQDVKAGEAALFNAFGTRLFLGQLKAALVAGGAFLNFDIEQRKVTLAGFAPEGSPSAGAAYISVDTTSIGMVSATGAASVTVAGDQVTMSGGNASIDTGSVVLGKDAADFVALASLVLAELQALKLYVNTHVHTSLGGTPLVLQPGGGLVPANYSPSSVASSRVHCA